MADITNFRDYVHDRLQDDANKLGTWVDDTSTIYDTYIQEAVKQYSKRRPRKMIYAHTVTSNEGSIFELPSDWETDFSWIINIEYPINTTEPKTKFPPQILNPKAYEVQQIPAEYRIRFLETPYPTAGDEFWVRYVIRHTVSASLSSIPASDEEAVSNLAVHYAAAALARRYATTTDSSITADVVTPIAKSTEYRDLARDAKADYDEAVKDETTGIIGEWDYEDMYYGTDALTHDRDKN